MCPLEHMAFFYRVQNGTSNTIFCKFKVTPMKTKTLPMMELVAVHSAFRALTTILTSYSNMESICISVDAQVALSWLLTVLKKKKKRARQNVCTPGRG